jgi:hypothetical protein
MGMMVYHGTLFQQLINHGLPWFTNYWKSDFEYLTLQLQQSVSVAPLSSPSVPSGCFGFRVGFPYENRVTILPRLYHEILMVKLWEKVVLWLWNDGMFSSVK